MDRADLREIDHDRWVPFLTEFSKAHFGEPVRVRVVGRPDVPDAGPAADASAGPVTRFQSIAERADAAGDRIDVVTVPEQPVAHVVSHPIHVRVSDPAGDRPLVVEIDDADGSTTLLKFLSDNAGEA